jgi:hypothetical protein
MRTTAAAAPAEAAATLWRCGGRQCGAGECEHEEGELHRHASGPGPEHAPPIVHEVLGSSGAPLSTGVQLDMERRLGHHFGDVRIHTGDRAAESAAAVHAHAYTVGRQIVFGSGEFDPTSSSGRRLLAHELTHAAGAAPGTAPPAGPLRVSNPDEPAERHAEHRAQRHVEHHAARLAAPPATPPASLLRDVDDEAETTDVAIPLATSTSGTFKDDLKTNDKTVSIGGIHSADWDQNVKARLGGDGGKVEVSVDSSTPSLNASGLIDGLTYTATITKTTATVDTANFTNAAEIKAAQDLATALQKHEQKHKDNEVNGRTGFAATMKGNKESQLDPALKALECKVGKTQRTLDNAEGMTTLGANNTVTQSGVDHPEYEDPCKP